MNFTGRLLNVKKNWTTDKFEVTFEIDDSGAAQYIDEIAGIEKLTIEAKKWHKPRSGEANRLMWHCIGQIAKALKTDKWDVYLEMLKSYGGKHDYYVMRPKAFEVFRTQFRTCEEIGEVEVNGKPAIQVVCYYGSSTYDSNEFRELLDGIIEEMKSMGLQPPSTSEMQIALEQWEKEHEVCTTN